MDDKQNILYPVTGEPTISPVRRFHDPAPDPSPLFEVRRRARTGRRQQKATELYRLFDATGILLYVGVTMQNAGGRLEQHAQTKFWWHLVSKVTIARESTWGSFEHDEYEAIINEFPVFNIDGVPWRTQRFFNRNDIRDCMLNRSLLMGIVARTGDAGVAGRLRILKQTEPAVYARVEEWTRAATERGDPPISLARMMLIRAEERYLERTVVAGLDRQSTA